MAPIDPYVEVCVRDVDKTAKLARALRKAEEPVVSGQQPIDHIHDLLDRSATNGRYGLEAMAQRE